MSQAARSLRIKQFFDTDSVRYLTERYPGEPRTCDQFSYQARSQYVLEMLGRTGKPGRVLDIGCGPAVLTRDLVQRGWKTTGMDLSSGMLAAASRAVSSLPAGSARFSAGAATSLPFQSGLFDAVLCIGVVSYIDDVPLLLNEVRRVLRPGGQAIFQISNASSVAAVDAWAWHQLRRFMSLWRKMDEHDTFRTAVKLHWHRPAAFDRRLATAGLKKCESRLYDFRPPVVVDRMSQSVSLAIGRRLEPLGASPLSTALASGYLVRVARSGDRS